MSKKKLAKPAEVESYEPDYDGWAEPEEYEAFNPFSKPTDPDVKPGTWTEGFHETHGGWYIEHRSYEEHLKTLNAPPIAIAHSVPPSGPVASEPDPE